MLGRFPQFIDFTRYCDARKTLEGSLSFKFCHRLAAQTENTNGEITFELNFGVDEFANRFVCGRLETKVLLICQRCMDTFEYPISVDLGLAFVSSTIEEEKIKGMYESYFYEGGSQTDLHALIEDEIMLELPLIAKHKDSECSIASEFRSDAKNNAVDREGFNGPSGDAPSGDIKSKGAEQDKNDAQMEKPNPFDILKQLKD